MEAVVTKKCPFCSEEILETAKKCKHCGEMIDVTMMRTAVAAVPIAQVASGGKGLAITSMILGIVGLFSFWFAIVLGILAIVFGVYAKKAMERTGNYTGKGMAKAGIILGIIDIAYAVILSVFIGGLFGLLAAQST